MRWSRRRRARLWQRVGSTRKLPAKNGAAFIDAQLSYQSTLGDKAGPLRGSIDTGSIPERKPLES